MYKFRLFKLLLAYLMGKRQDDLRVPVNVRLRVTPFEAELTHASSYSYMAYAALGRWSWNLACMDLGRMWRERWTPFTHSELVYYRRALSVFDRVELSTTLIWWDEKMAWFEHRISHEGQLAAIVYSRGAFYSQGKRVPLGMDRHGRPVPLPDSKPAIVDAWTATDAEFKKSLG